MQRQERRAGRDAADVKGDPQTRARSRPGKEQSKQAQQTSRHKRDVGVGGRHVPVGDGVSLSQGVECEHARVLTLNGSYTFGAQLLSQACWGAVVAALGRVGRSMLSSASDSESEQALCSLGREAPRICFGSGRRRNTSRGREEWRMQPWSLIDPGWRQQFCVPAFPHLNLLRTGPVKAVSQRDCSFPPAASLSGAQPSQFPLVFAPPPTPSLDPSARCPHTP